MRRALWRARRGRGECGQAECVEGAAQFVPFRAVGRRVAVAFLGETRVTRHVAAARRRAEAGRGREVHGGVMVKLSLACVCVCAEVCGKE